MRSAGVVPDVPPETKFHPPRARPEWVARPDLIGRLARCDARLVLVDAPAGFGKTTFAAQWRSSLIGDRRFAWLSLDAGDNDPGRLWWHVVCSLQRACAGFAGSDLSGALRAQVPDITGTVIPDLVNELAALQVPVVLALDDYHVIKERACHEQVGFLLRHLPPSAQLVLITRADPPLPLGRLRAAGEMVEIRAGELRFTPGQAAVFVRAVAGVQLGEPDLAVLMERTEGWPAGVYLAALSLRGHRSPGTFIGNFTGNNRFIFEYLAEEVLSRQPPEIQQFLVRTSILPRLCAPLCEAVTGSHSAAQILDMLERENLFVLPLDDDQRWYRYHSLFRQVLRGHLARAEPGIVRALHQRASAWHRRHGPAEDAVGHALAADDVACAVDLMAQSWYAYAGAGRAPTVQRWVRALGDDRAGASSLAAHCAAWAAAVSGDRQAVRRWLPVIEAAPDDGPLPDGMRSLKSSAALLRAVYGFDGLRVMRQSAVTAVGLENDPASPWYALARAALGFSLYLSGEAEPAARTLEEAVAAAASLPKIRMLALSVLSLVMVEQGRLSRAAELADAARALAGRGELRAAPQSSLAYTAAGAVHAAHGQFRNARAELEYACRSLRKVPGISPWPTLEATLWLARVHLALGDRPTAAGLAGEAKAVLSVLADDGEALQARLAEISRQIAGNPGPAPIMQLTEREAAILRLFEGSLSVREIGQQLHVSQNTVKTHAKAIYRKLGVSSRQDAIEQGKGAGLL